MGVAPGHAVYCADAPPVIARGIAYTGEELDAAIDERVAPIVYDTAGLEDLRQLLEPLAETKFQVGRLNAVLLGPQNVPSWRVGEALAEAYLTDHCGCCFPWPSGRDVKTPSASPSGTDLMGFHRVDGDTRFAFGEVKTSGQERWPPTGVTGRHGLREQLSKLRDCPETKDMLVKYLGHHAPNTRWRAEYQAAAKRYFGDPTDTFLFGVLIRDVQPNSLDLAAPARSLAHNCPQRTFIELTAIYLPGGSIDTLPKAIQRKGGESGAYPPGHRRA